LLSIALWLVACTPRPTDPPATAGHGTPVTAERPPRRIGGESPLHCPLPPDAPTGQQLTALVRVGVDSTGAPTEIDVLRHDGPDTEAAAAECVKRQRFAAALDTNGVTTWGTLQLDVRFENLSPPRSPVERCLPPSTHELRAGLLPLRQRLSPRSLDALQVFIHAYNHGDLPAILRFIGPDLLLVYQPGDAARASLVRSPAVTLQEPYWEANLDLSGCHSIRSVVFGSMSDVDVELDCRNAALFGAIQPSDSLFREVVGGYVVLDDAQSPEVVAVADRVTHFLYDCDTEFRAFYFSLQNGTLRLLAASFVSSDR